LKKELNVVKNDVQSEIQSQTHKLFVDNQNQYHTLLTDFYTYKNSNDSTLNTHIQSLQSMIYNQDNEHTKHCNQLQSGWDEEKTQ
jgi:uncharacterized protein YjcR